MVSESRSLAKSDALRKNVRVLGVAVESLPAHAVLLPVIRTLELHLQRRGLLKAPPGEAFTPIWFIAETERNVFLWRSGLSLIQQDEFEFWVNIPKLVEKRLRQLESADADNPFLNPLWAASGADPEITLHEREYLKSMVEIIRRVGPHAHAFSRAGNDFLREYFGSAGEEERKVVLLPAS